MVHMPSNAVESMAGEKAFYVVSYNTEQCNSLREKNLNFRMNFVLLCKQLRNFFLMDSQKRALLLHSISNLP